MTAKETDRLNTWLIANGHSPKEVIECIKYIATGQNLKIIVKHKKRVHRCQPEKL